MPCPKNHLEHNASLYLREHANNPVEWYPFSEEIFQMAKERDLPILLSIGYASCYWCHVMERDVFMDEGIAEEMNRHFINVKIDREERPDLDALCMAVRQAITQEGGWPNHVWLTPEGKPFFAGGTFAPDRRYGMSFTDLIHAISDKWEHNRDEIIASSEQINAYVEARFVQKEKAALPYEVMSDASVLAQTTDILLQYSDKEMGGFFRAPKFPQELYLLYLLGSSEVPALEQVKKTLDAMMLGGIHDHIGGGFHRYSVDAEWHVPHFEKMLYTQSLLLRCYARAYRETAIPLYKEVVKRIVEHTVASMRDAQGGYISAIDAETEAVEGAYYVWRKEEINAHLETKMQTLWWQCFALAPVPEMSGHKHPDGEVLFVKDRVAFETHYETLVPLYATLLSVRKKRPLPIHDTKVITAWHAMMIASLAEAGEYCEEPAYTALAEEAANTALEVLCAEAGAVYRTSHSKEPGFLEDYAHLIDGFLTLYRVTSKITWNTHAEALMQEVEKRFADSARGDYFATDAETTTLLRIKDTEDGALPSATSVMLHNLLTLADTTRERTWYMKAVKLLQVTLQEALESPLNHIHFLHGYRRYLRMGWGIGTHLYAIPLQCEMGCLTLEVVVKEGFTVYGPEVAKEEGEPLTAHVKVDEEWVEAKIIAEEPFHDRFVALLHYASSGKVTGWKLRYQACGEGTCAVPEEVSAVVV